jgi:DNA-binding LacI/PurR family transcriptional regulator
VITRVSIREIAVRTGYSTATVSMALREHPRLPPATRATVQRVAREMGYRPDPVLASIAASRWRGHPARAVSTLALIKDRERMEGEQGLVQYAARLGYQLESFHVRDYPSGGRLSQILYHRGILGVAVGQIFTPGFCDTFDWSKFTTVALSEGAFRPPTHLVMPDHFRAVQGAWDYAAARGARRIGMIVFDMPFALDFHDRCAAYQDRQAGLPPDRRLPVLALKDWNRQSRAERTAVDGIVRQWVEHHRPDCMLGFNEAFWWILRAAGWRGVANPDGFVCLWKTASRPQLPGFLLPPDEIGRRSLEWLDSLLRTGDRGLPGYPATMQIAMRWEPADPHAPPLDAASRPKRRSPRADVADSAPTPRRNVPRWRTT